MKEFLEKSLEKNEGRVSGWIQVGISGKSMQKFLKQYYQDFEIISDSFEDIIGGNVGRIPWKKNSGVIASVIFEGTPGEMIGVPGGIWRWTSGEITKQG